MGGQRGMGQQQNNMMGGQGGGMNNALQAMGSQGMGQQSRGGPGSGNTSFSQGTLGQQGGFQQQNMGGMVQGNNSNMMGQQGMQQLQNNNMRVQQPNWIQQQQNNMMGQQGNNNNMMMGQNDQQSLLMGGNRLSNGYGQSQDMMGRYNDFYDPMSQPLFGQQYYQRSGNSEDFRQASRYTAPRGRQAVGDYDNSFVGTYMDDTGARERRLRQYRMNDMNDFGYRGNFDNRLGSSEDFRQTASVRGPSSGFYTSGRNVQGLTPREREMRQQQIDDYDNDYQYQRQQRYNTNDIYRENKLPPPRFQRWQNNLLKQNQQGDDYYYDRRGNNNGNRSNSNRDGDWYDGRDDDYYSTPRYSRSDDFRQGRSNRGRDYGTPREREMRQMADNRELGREYRRDDDYDRYDSRYDGRRERSRSNNGYEKYYDPEIVETRSSRKKKTSVWENLRDA